jgi:DNA replication protein DnaC
MSAKKSEQCPRCGGRGWRPVTDEAGRVRFRMCECRLRSRRRDLLAESAIPPRYAHCTFERYDGPYSPTQRRALETCRRFVDEFPHCDAGLLLTGNCGVGKTHLAVSALREIAVEKGHSVLFADSRELIGEIRAGFDDAAGINSYGLVRRVLGVELLLLDDLGAYHLTSWVRDTFADIITRRFNARRHIIITTNYPDQRSTYQKETLADRIGERLRSRLYELCRHVHIGGTDDFRQKVFHAGHEPE